MQSIPQRGALNREANERRAVSSLYFPRKWKQEAKGPAAKALWSCKSFLTQPADLNLPVQRPALHQSLTHISITLNNKLEGASTGFLLCQCFFPFKAAVAASISSHRLCSVTTLNSFFPDVGLLTWTQSKQTNDKQRVGFKWTKQGRQRECPADEPDCVFTWCLFSITNAAFAWERLTSQSLWGQGW